MFGWKGEVSPGGAGRMGGCRGGAAGHRGCRRGVHTVYKQQCGAPSPLKVDSSGVGPARPRAGVRAVSPRNWHEPRVMSPVSVPLQVKQVQGDPAQPHGPP